MGLKALLEYRLDVHEEVQGWILLFCTVTAVFICCLPCYCAGLQSTLARRFAQMLGRNWYAFYIFAAVFNMAFMGIVVNAMPDWTLPVYVKTLVTTILGTLKHLLDGATSIVIIALFCFTVAFKDRIAQLAGFDHKTLFRFKIRDCLTCFGPRFKPIELAVWKVEDLQSADPFTANNVFIEFFLGYNEPAYTRVHNNAGSACHIRQSLHLNFDEYDEEETLFIFVKSQKVLGTTLLGRAEIPSSALAELVRKPRPEGGRYEWSERHFQSAPITLMPHGRLWLAAQPIDEEHAGESVFDGLSTC